MHACMPHGGGCNRRAFCAAHHVWAEAQARLVEVLDEATMERLAAESSHWLALAGGDAAGEPLRHRKFATLE